MVLDVNPSSTTENDAASAGASDSETYTNHPFGSRSCVADRKLGLLKRTGLFGDDLKGCTIERACSAEDLRQAYRLVHDVYLGTGFIHPDPSGMRLRIYETTAETATFIAKFEGRVVGVLSVVEDSPDLGLPADCVFKPELDELRRAGRRLCEVTNQAVAPEYRKSGVPTELMRCAIAVSLTEGYDEANAAVSPSHNGFYDLLGFRQVGSLRSYSKSIDDPVIAVSMDIDQYRTPQSGLSSTGEFMREFLTESNRFLSRVVEWAQEAREQFLNPDLLKQLFVLERNFLARCTPDQLRILHNRWGHDRFMAVTGDTLLSVFGDSDPETENHSAPDAAVPTRSSRPKSRTSGRSRYTTRRPRQGFPEFGAMSGSEAA